MFNYSYSSTAEARNGWGCTSLPSVCLHSISKDKFTWMTSKSRISVVLFGQRIPQGLCSPAYRNGDHKSQPVVHVGYWASWIQPICFCPISVNSTSHSSAISLIHFVHILYTYCTHFVHIFFYKMHAKCRTSYDLYVYHSKYIFLSVSLRNIQGLSGMHPSILNISRTDGLTLT